MKTVVLGASPNKQRFSHKAVKSLLRHDFEVVPVGIRKGEIVGIEILLDKPMIEDVDTIALYIGPRNQAEYFDYIISLKPRRIILNPGTENQELSKLAKDNDIEALEDCTLVMLNAGRY